MNNVVRSRVWGLNIRTGLSPPNGLKREIGAGMEWNGAMGRGGEGSGGGGDGGKNKVTPMLYTSKGKKGIGTRPADNYEDSGHRTGDETIRPEIY